MDAVRGTVADSRAAVNAAGAFGAAPPECSLEKAYAFCGKLAMSHYENFTVASWLMPRTMRKHMHAIYAYARIADDFADEEHDLAKLDGWERELDLAYAGTPRLPVFIALADTAAKFAIPKAPFADLLVAFRSDVNFKGFDTFDGLLGYCRYSANPVGRLVLYLFGYADSECQRLSDLVCSGLQLANFWQDVSVDLAKGRVYFPRRDLAAYELTEQDLRHGVATKRFADLMKHEVDAARAMLAEGATGLARIVDQRLRRDILMFAGGGLAILRAIENAGYDVLRARPKLKKLDYVKLGWNALRGRLDGF
ncbi:MAG: squalene synthase HpnC [Candidatus Binataceae bacterium]